MCDERKSSHDFLFLRGISCTKTRPWSARIADKNSLLLPVSRNFMLKKALPTNPSAARHAEMHARLLPVKTVELAVCMTLYALSAARSVRFLLSPTMTVRYIAATASRNK